MGGLNQALTKTLGMLSMVGPQWRKVERRRWPRGSWQWLCPPCSPWWPSLCCSAAAQGLIPSSAESARYLKLKSFKRYRDSYHSIGEGEWKAWWRIRSKKKCQESTDQSAVLKWSLILQRDSPGAQDQPLDLPAFPRGAKHHFWTKRFYRTLLGNAWYIIFRLLLG